MTCLACGETLAPLDRFCEACGAPTADLEADRARLELDLGAVAAVSDRGWIRKRNEDAFSICTESGFHSAVVCDGVATTEAADATAITAAQAAIAELRHAGPDPNTWSDVATRSVTAAQGALCAESGTGAPLFEGSTTIVVALTGPGRIVVANVGDSRAYWVGRDGSGRILTTDDTWVREALAAAVSEEQVRSSSRAHEITAWLGHDAGIVDPHLLDYCPAGEGLLVLCSDGLWNYADPPEVLVTLAAGLVGSPADVARQLAGFALDHGGADNVTVVVAEVPQGIEE
jgi:serine/threonine protein phosphatase PrpC